MSGAAQGNAEPVTALATIFDETAAISKRPECANRPIAEAVRSR